MSDLNENKSIQEENISEINSQNAKEFPEAQKAPKSAKKPSALTAKVMAAVLAVSVIGGGSGFAGAYFASKLGASANFSQSSQPSETPEEKPARDPDSVSSVIGVINTENPSHEVSAEVERNSDGTYKYTRDLVSAVRDSVVYVEKYIDYYGTETLSGSASGIIISPDGYIITNHHVVNGSSAMKVKVFTTDSAGVSTSKLYDAKIVGADEDSDIAVLKIEASGLQAAKLGNSDELHLGDDVIVVGNPMHLEMSVAKGVVSGLDRAMSDSVRGVTTIQTDAAINGGNSGGALFNFYGEVVGVVRSKLIANYSESIGFAVTINEAKPVASDLIEYGYVRGRAILGIRYYNITQSTADRRGIPAGLQVTEIDSDLPIARSGLRPGDTIQAINGESVITGSVASILAKYSPGEVVKVTIIRGSTGEQTEIEIELSEYTE